MAAEISPRTAGNQGATSESSQTACTHCRIQKVKCSREIPACTRCVQRDQACYYPLPPDRRILALQRARPKRDQYPSRRLYNDLPTSTAERLSRDLDTPNSRFPPEPAAPPWDFRNRNAYDPRPRQGLSHSDVEPEFGIFLIEVYFTHCFTAALLFDYDSLIHDYRRHKVPRYLLLSIFAVASLYLAPSRPGAPGRKRSSPTAFAALVGRGLAWAEWGSQDVLSRVDKPSLSKVQACEILGLYWHSVGDFERAVMHATISRQSCRLIIRRRQLWGEQLLSHETQASRLPLGIRCAVWIKTCMVDDRSSDKAEMKDLDLTPEELSTISEGDLTSPSALNSCNSGATDWMIWDDVWMRNCAVHIVGLFSLWREVRLLVRQSWGFQTSSYLSSVLELEAKLHRVYAAIPAEVKADDKMSANGTERMQRNAMLLHAIYYCCLLSLHSSVVPMFSGSTADSKVSPTLLDSCGRTVLETAQNFMTLVKGFLRTSPDMTKISSFVAYATYLLGSVNAIAYKFLPRQQDAHLYIQGLICLRVVDSMAMYYPGLDSLCEDLKLRLSVEDQPQPSGAELLTLQELLQISSVPQPDGTMPLSVSREVFNSNTPEISQNPFIMRSFFHGQADVDSDDAHSDAADLGDADAASRDGHEVSREDHFPSVWPGAPPVSRFASTVDVELDYQNARLTQTCPSVPTKRHRGIHSLGDSQRSIPSVAPHPRRGAGSISGNDPWGVDIAPDGGAPLADDSNLPTSFGWNSDFAGPGWID